MNPEKKDKIFNQARVLQLHQEKGKLPKMTIKKLKPNTSEPQLRVIPEVEKTSKNDIIVERTITHKNNTRSITKRFNNMTTFRNSPKMFLLEAT